jgi:hypothetical protein
MRRLVPSLAALALVAGGFALTPANGASAGGPPPRIVFVGDSMGKQLYGTIFWEYIGEYVPIDQTKGACTLSRGTILGYNRDLYGGPGTNCHDWPAAFGQPVANADPDVIVLVVGGWDRPDRWGKTLPVPCSPGPWCPAPKFRITQPKGDARFLKNLTRAVETLRQHGVPVIVATEPYSKPKTPNQGTPKNAYWEPYDATPPGPTEAWPKGWRSPMKDGSTPYISGRTKSERIIQLADQMKATSFAGDPDVVRFSMNPLLSVNGEYVARICPFPGPLVACPAQDRVRSRLEDGAHLAKEAEYYVLAELLPLIDTLV